MSAAARPVAETERLEGLDVLRGFAVLGILVMNVQLFAMPYAATYNPAALGPPSSVDFTVWTLMHYRRMFWLLLFGLLHAYLLWYGDILVLYAVCGMLLYPLRNLRPRSLIMLGVAVFAVASLIPIAGYLQIAHQPPEALAEVRQFWWPDPAALAAEVEAFRGGWLAQMPLRSAYSLDFHTFDLWTSDLWHSGGLMLLGMALFKLGVLSGDRPRSFYVRIAIVGFAVGTLLTGWGVVRNVAEGWRAEYSPFLGSQWNYWGSVFSAFGWTGAVLAVWKSGALRGVIARLAVAGRMAFTCYILETLICTIVFYGDGLGLFGSVGRPGQLGVTAAVWVVLLVLAPWWLGRFRFGPLEWLWRCLTYGRIEPLRARPRRAAAAA